MKTYLEKYLKRRERFWTHWVLFINTYGLWYLFSKKYMLTPIQLSSLSFTNLQPPQLSLTLTSYGWMSFCSIIYRSVVQKSINPTWKSSITIPLNCPVNERARERKRDKLWFDNWNRFVKWSSIWYLTPTRRRNERPLIISTDKREYIQKKYTPLLLMKNGHICQCVGRSP